MTTEIYPGSQYKLHPTEKRIRNYTRNATSYMIKQGIIKRHNKCQDCGSKRSVEGHHPDYSDPYRLVWLCSFCHSMIRK